MKFPCAASVAVLMAASVPALADRLDGIQIGTGSALTIAFLHGDQSSGGDPNYLANLGIEVAKRLPDATIHMLLRPGYTDPWGRQSPGENHGRRDQYTMASADVIFATLEELKTDAPLLVVGHSGGAAQTALVLSRTADLIDAAILVGCPCDLDLWAAANPGWPDDMFTRSTSAVDVTPVMSGRVTVIIGEVDSVTPVEQSRSYVQHLQTHGVAAQLVTVPGGDHVGNRALTRVWLQTVLDEAGRLAK